MEEVTYVCCCWWELGWRGGYDVIELGENCSLLKVDCDDTELTESDFRNCRDASNVDDDVTVVVLYDADVMAADAGGVGMLN